MAAIRKKELKEQQPQKKFAGRADGKAIADTVKRLLAN